MPALKQHVKQAFRVGLASINPLTLGAQLFPGSILASRALSLCPEVKDDDVVKWGEGTRGTQAKIHTRQWILSYHCTLEDWCFSGRLVRGKGPSLFPQTMPRISSKAAHHHLLPKANHRKRSHNS